MAQHIKWDKEQISELKRLYPQLGTSCASIIGLTYAQVKSKANKLGIKISNERRIQNARKNIKKAHEQNYLNARKVNHLFFSNCNCKESAYLLGFLWADGYLNNISQHCNVRLEIVTKDAEQIMPIFNASGQWGIYHRNRPNRQPQTIFLTGQKPLYEFLEKNGYENKSEISSSAILSNIPKNLHPFWWRGYSDGDGCFYVNLKNNCYQYMMAGSYNQDWIEVEKLMKEININCKVKQRIHKNSKSSVVRISNKKDVVKFGKYIYGNEYDGMGLLRKYEKYLLICNN